MSRIQIPRQIFKPFEYPKAFDYCKHQQNLFWLPSEIGMTEDVADWKILSDSERKVIGQILKSFTQTETHINEYWSQNISKWFPKPEIMLMSSTFSAFESIHTEAYDYLNTELGLEDYESFLQDSTAMNKLNRLKDSDKSDSTRNIARNLAIFSAFTEGVSLYSSFAILANLSRFNLLKGVKNIIAWSQRDEELHSVAGCWLFRTLIEENPEIWDDELKSSIYEAARLTVELEDDFINQAFSLGEIRGLDPKDLKTFIRDRANHKLIELGLKNNWKNLDKESLSRMNWFYTSSNALNNTDFFTSRSSEYTRVNWKVEDMF